VVVDGNIQEFPTDAQSYCEEKLLRYEALVGAGEVDRGAADGQCCC
jgi:hypothetical protein